MTRVYWHGAFPDIDMKGTIIQRGTVRHEVLWDGASQPRLEGVDAVKLVSQYKRCDCGRCGVDTA